MKSCFVRISASLVATLAFMVVGTASAQYRDRYHERNDVEYDYAEVIRVDPIIDAVERPIRRDECWREPVIYREPLRYRDGHRDRAPALLAGIVGGVIGNQFGGGSGRDAATAAGALLGYSMARDSQRRHGGGYYVGGREYRTYERRCATRTDYVADERVAGYDVTYRYHGRVYHTVTDYHPGDRIRLRINVDTVP